MSYEIGVSSSPADLLDKIRIVAESEGWTTNIMSDVSPSLRWLSLQVGTSYFNLLSELRAGDNNYDKGNVIYGAQATGFNAALAWDLQPGTSAVPADPGQRLQTCCKCNELFAPFTSYRIYSSPTYIHVVIETNPNVFSHILIGVLNKYGAYTGGAYMTMTHWAGNVLSPFDPESTYNCYPFDNNAGEYSYKHNPAILRAHVDGWVYHYNTIIPATGSYAHAYLGLYRGNFGRDGVNEIQYPNRQAHLRTPNAFNQITPLLPSTLYISRPSGLKSPIGEVPDMRPLNMLRYNAGDTLTLGSDNWDIFPVKSNSPYIGSGTIPTSLNYGIAYKRVV